MKVLCNFCLTKFIKKPAEINRTNNNFCSKSCAGLYKQRQSIASFMDMVEINQSNGCWEWQGYLNNHGYGIKRFQGKPQLAHRVSHIIYKGEIGDCLCVLHKCDNPSCVNPEHLFLGTHMDNMDDKIKKSRGFSKISPPQAEYIRKSDDTTAELARRFCVSERTIRNYRPSPPQTMTEAEQIKEVRKGRT